MRTLLTKSWRAAKHFHRAVEPVEQWERMSLIFQSQLIWRERKRRSMVSFVCFFSFCFSLWNKKKILPQEVESHSDTKPFESWNFINQVKSAVSLLNLITHDTCPFIWIRVEQTSCRIIIFLVESKTLELRHQTCLRFIIKATLTSFTTLFLSAVISQLSKML